MRPTAIFVALVVLLLAGCGGDDKTTSTTAQPNGRTTDRKGITFDDAPRSRRDADVERNLKRHLKQEAAFAGGWTFADIRAVQTRGRQVVIETRLKPGEREPASSLCLAARRSFQDQDAYGVTVTERDDSVLVEC